MVKNIEIYHKIKSMHQKVKYFLFLLAGIVFSGCVKQQSFLFEIPYQRDFEIKAGLNPVEEHNFLLNNFFVDTAVLFGSRNITSDKISSIVPVAMQIVNLSGNSSFDFVNDVSLIVSDRDIPNLNFEAFYRDPVPADTGPQIDMVATLADFKQIILKNNFNARVRFRLRRTTQEFITVRVVFKFGVR